MTERDSIIDVVFRFALAIDTRDWHAYRSLFSDEITIDYRS